MTTSIAEQLARARASSPARGAEPRVLRTMRGDFVAHLAAMLERVTRVSWPDPKYRREPVRFFREILGVEPWHRQVEVIESVRDAKRVAVKSGHKVSKVIANDTLVPTPDGWRRHGDLRVDDVVFAVDGTPCRVIDTIAHTEEVLRIHFEDRTYVDCGENHQWEVRSRELRKPRNAGKPSLTLTARELFDEQRVPNGRDGYGVPRSIANWTIDLPAPVQLPPADLPLRPYLLGLWLGDGSSNGGGFTNADGLEQAFRAAGFEVTGSGKRTTRDGRPVQWYVRGLVPRLRALRVLDDKHIPECYLWASEPQRRALLAGLLDTDGHVTKRGRVCFTSTRHNLAAGVATLARSLGIKARIDERRAMLDGRDVGPFWSVQWASPEPVFRLERKARRVKRERGNKRLAHTRMAIERIERLGRVEAMQCIEIAHPSHLYLVGESFVPTHNSHTAAGIALWFWCSYADARVVMTSSTSRQVDEILWRETRMMRARAGLCVECKTVNERRAVQRSRGELVEDIEAPCIHSAMIGGEVGELARTGLKSADFREIKGFTAREAEAVAGISGRNLLYILDEASGIKPEIFEAIEGNRAGGARVVMFSNPTRTSGEFYDAFNSKERFYSCHTISSEETPNVVHGDDSPEAIPGLATRDWIREKRDEWGEDSPLYRVRVLGEFCELEEGKIFSIHAIAEAEARWATTPATGRLWIGFDPSGDGPAGDEAVWCLRRGQRVLSMVAQRGLSRQALLMHTLGIVRENRHEREIPVVVIDAEGKVGAEVSAHFRTHLASRDEPEFELVGIRASDKAHRTPLVYDRLRDELAGNLLAWMSDGGAIVSDVKLAAELHAFEWIEQVNGRVKVTAKKDVKKALGRSPDRYDALSLCVWEPLAIKDGKPPRKATSPQQSVRERTPSMDPYAAAEAMDPYGGRGRRR